MNKVNWLILLLSVAILAAGKPASGQASIYVEGTSDYLNNGPYSDFLYGGTAGVLVGLSQMWHERIVLSVDLQGNFVFNNTEPGSPATFYSAGEMYDAITVGPRLSLTPRFFTLSPYVQMNVGFARYHDPLTHSTSDFVIGGQAGVTRRLTRHLDAVLDYSYSSFGYNSGYYSPQTFSLGAIYHFAKR